MGFGRSTLAATCIAAWLFYSSKLTSAACPTPVSSTVEYVGRNIKMSDVVACGTINRGKSVIAIYSFDNVTVDAHYPGFQGSDIEPSLLIITPMIILDGVKNINLNGENGASPPSKPSGKGTTKGVVGISGKTSGSSIIAYREKAHGGTFNFVLNGGNGGDGQHGQDSVDGSNGAHKPVRQYNEEDCNAWSGGWVRVNIRPNKCYEQMNGDRCKADDSGARIDVYGFDGTRGGNGNDGGEAGRGGNGGIALVAQIGAEHNTTTVGAKGTNGQPGRAGTPGKGGKKGDTNALTIDDAAGSSGKRCKILYQSYVTSNEFASDGSAGRDGGNTGAKTPPATFELKQFIPSLTSYVNKCVIEALEGDDIDVDLLQFCKDVSKHFNLS